MHPIQRRPIVRITTGLLIALAALIPAALSTSAQENGLASITIYSSLCPPDYQQENYYDDCYDTPAGEGIDFTLTNLEDPSDTYTGTSGPSGFAAIEGIDHDGLFQLSFDVPFPISSAPGNCSEDGSPFDVGSEYQMNLTTDNDIRCDIFISPAGDDDPNPPFPQGTVSIYLTACDPGYTGTDFYEDCYGNPVEKVSLIARPDERGVSTDRSGLPITDVTDGSGNASLLLGEGAWNVAADLPGGYIDRLFVYCSQSGQRYDIEIVDLGFYLNVPGGADVRCDWYIVPTDSQGDDGGSITIYYTSCPAGYSGSTYYPDCYDNPKSGFTFIAFAPKLDFEASGVTGANGVVTLPLPANNSIGSPISLNRIPQHEVPKGTTEPPFFLYCTADGNRIDVNYSLVQRDAPGAHETPPTDIFAVSISPDPGADVRCDWYDLPPGQSPAPSPAPSPSPSVRPVTQLPNTGAGITSNGMSTDLIIGIALFAVAGSAGAYALSRKQNHHAA